MAELYERSRPGYPDDLVSWLVEQLRLGPGKTVADVGAGTGKLTRLLVPTGARVIAVEPLPEMRAELERAVDGVEIVAGRAEELPFDDGSLDAVTAAAAFHWFEPAQAYPELRRVLRPEGSLAIVGNGRDFSDPLQVALQELLAPYLPPREDLPKWPDDLVDSGLFVLAAEFDGTHEQLLDADGLADRMATVSFVARVPEPERRELLARVRDLGAAQPTELFAFRYRSEAYVFHRRDAV